MEVLEKGSNAKWGQTTKVSAVIFMLHQGQICTFSAKSLDLVDLLNNPFIIRKKKLNKKNINIAETLGQHRPPFQ